MAMQPQMTGVESLMDFQDNMTSSSGLERLKALQTLGLMSLAEDQYMNPNEVPYESNTGLSGLPQVQMGFGGFISRVFKAVSRPFKAVAKGIKSFAKSKIGRIALPLALSFGLPWMAGYSFAANPYIYSGLAGLGSGIASLAAGVKPGDALKQAGLSALMTFGGGKLFQKFAPTAQAGEKALSTGLGRTGEMVGSNVGRSITQQGLVDTGGAGFLGSGFPEVGAKAAEAARAARVVAGGTQSLGSLGLSGTLSSARNTAAQELMRQAANVPQFSATSFLGGGTAGAPSFQIQPGAENIFKGDTTMQAFKNLPKQLVQYGKEALTKPETYGGFARDLVPHPLDVKEAKERATERQRSLLSDQGFTEVFDQGTWWWRHPTTKQRLSLSDALAYGTQQTAPFTGSQRLAQAETSGFGPLVPQLMLGKSGGLIGMAYGGQMPEFSGMVQASGGGMEDNVRMPIIDKQRGEQVATLAVSPKEYVVDSHTMAALGNGNPDEGAKVMDQTIKQIRQKAYGSQEQPNEISGLNALQPMIRSI